MDHIRNIIVTGCNKGIGYAIVENLASKKNWNIIMAVRNLQLGQTAKEDILAKYPDSKLNI
jgi:NAD(P)-dependent dehydrogenase (short-subunit alcohol dehydrogenase family)